MTLTQLLFSIKGRISRLTFWLCMLAISAIIFGPEIFYSGMFADEAGSYIGIAYLALLWPALAVQAKRWHDRDKSAWWLLINLIPFFGPLWALVEIGFLAGTPGVNSYGPNPLQQTDEASQRVPSDFGANAPARLNRNVNRDTALPSFLLRLKWTALTLVTLTGIAIAGLVVNFTFYLVTGLFFLGSTGREADNFIVFFVPFGYFAEGAFVFGGIVALLSAMLIPKKYWKKFIAASAVAGGLAAAAIPTLGHRLTVLTQSALTALPNPFHSPSFAKEEALAAAFAKNQQAVILAVGKNVKTGRVLTTTSHGTPVQFDVEVSGDRAAYAIVNVSRSWGRVDFTLLCVTPLAMAYRDVRDPCKH